MIDRIFKNRKTTIIAIVLAGLPWLAHFINPEFVGVLEIAEFYTIVFLGGIFLKDKIQL